mgnify:CR=1 FL=1
MRIVRWQHPTRGFVSPAEFVPFAEQAGYITMVTQWMLQQALSTLAAWAPTHPELSIAVNVSTRDLQHKGFAERVGRLIEASGVPAKRLRIEITEINKKFLRADVIEVLEASEHRVAAPCEYAGVCGGCDCHVVGHPPR